MHKNPYKNLIRDLFLVGLSVFVSVWIARLGLLDNIATFMPQANLLLTFVAGFFFTSVFTIAVASVVLLSLAAHVAPAWLAFWGALGALCGDLTIFLFVSDRFTQDITEVLKITKTRKLSKFFHKGYFRWLSPLIGALIIASPLPDEIGISMMGISKTRSALLIPICFTMNFIAIWLIAHAGGLV